ncbi:MAG: nucleoside deaminase, partial [Chitinophagia bacterium]|nr:nucleoside deaminase [Chitinophagia bacterium]
NNFNLGDCRLFSSCEPCPMCLSAIYWAKIKNVYYANTKTDAKNIGFDDQEIYEELNKSIDERKISIKNIELRDPSIELKDYAASPYRTKTKSSNKVDTTCFNKGNWLVAIDQIKIGNGAFKLNYNSKKPVFNEFDADHMDIKQINLLIEKTKIVKDTIKSSICYLNAKERCGLMLKQFKSNVIVSPNKTICNQLYIATNNSEIKDHYAMYYKRFPDFLNYMETVRMVANFKNAKIDLKDVAYFSRSLDVIPYQVLLNTNFEGTVDAFKATALIKAPHIQFKGDLAINGLPNWETSVLNIEKAHLNIDKKGIEYYAPKLAKNKSFQFSSLGDILMEGSFKGTTNQFVTKNSIKTAIGNAQVDLNIVMPKEKNKLTAYNGKIVGQGIALGKLIGNKEIGKVDANLKIDGKGFDINEAEINLDGNLNNLEIKQYAYQQLLIKLPMKKNVLML